MSGSTRILGLAAMLVLVSVGQVNADLTTNLIGYWQFDGDGQDSSGSSKDLTL